jgi:general secretion pathway protein E
MSGKPLSDVNPLAGDALEPNVVARARTRALQDGSHIFAALARETGLDETQTVAMLAARLRMASFDTRRLEQAVPDFSVWTFGEASRLRCAVVEFQRVRFIVLTDAFDDVATSRIEARFGQPIERALAHPGDFAAWLARREESVLAMSALRASAAAETLPEEGGGEQLSLAGITNDESPVVRIVNSTLYDGLKAEASDIHLETHPDGLHVVYRIDGVLNRVAHVADRELAARAISRVKVLAELDIAETRVPQDGRFKASINGRAVDCASSTSSI